MELVVVTGLSGAGKSKALNLIEDIDYYCVDNMPPELIPVFVDLCLKSNEKMAKVAIGVDVRSSDNFTSLLSLIRTLKRDERVNCRVIFFDAATPVIIRRYKESRRPHPLSARIDGTIEQIIEYERRMLLPMMEVSDYIIDTSTTTIGQLWSMLSSYLLGKTRDTAIRILSFGYKNGLPPECDMVFDMRGLPNPFYVKDFKTRTGLEAPVADYVFSFPQAEDLCERIEQLILTMLPLLNKEGRASLCIGIGCTGGQHRSVAMAQRLAADLRLGGKEIEVVHRELGITS